MLIAALLVGLITAYYLGVRAGMIAAGTAAGLFFVARVVPGAGVVAYGAVAVGLIGLCWIGPKLRRPETSNRAASWLRSQAARRMKRRFW